MRKKSTIMKFGARTSARREKAPDNMRACAHAINTVSVYLRGPESSEVSVVPKLILIEFKK